jgi:hypothetical protein
MSWSGMWVRGFVGAGYGIFKTSHWKASPCEVHGCHYVIPWDGVVIRSTAWFSAKWGGSSFFEFEGSADGRSADGRSADGGAASARPAQRQGALRRFTLLELCCILA